MRNIFSYIILTSLLLLTACSKNNNDQGASNNTTRVALKTVTLTVEKMTCAACPITVRLALKKVPGVATAKVDYKTKTAVVSFDPKRTNISALNKATKNAGYPSTLKRSSE